MEATRWVSSYVAVIMLFIVRNMTHSKCDYSSPLKAIRFLIQRLGLVSFPRRTTGKTAYGSDRKSGIPEVTLHTSCFQISLTCRRSSVQTGVRMNDLQLSYKKKKHMQRSYPLPTLTRPIQIISIVSDLFIYYTFWSMSIGYLIASVKWCCSLPRSSSSSNFMSSH